MATENNIPILFVDINGASTPAFTLQPAQTSAFEVSVKVDWGTLTTDSSAYITAVDVNGVNVAQTTYTEGGSGLSVYTTSPFPYRVYNSTAINRLTFSVVATGARVFYPKEHTSTFTIQFSGTWLSGNDVGGASTAVEPITTTSSPMICTFNIVFSTANIAPCAITGFTAVASGTNSLGLTWTNPTYVGISSIWIAQTVNKTPSARSDFSSLYILSSSTQAKYLPTLDTSAGVMYGFAAWVRDINGDFSLAALASASTTWISPGGRVWSSRREQTRKWLLGYFG